MDKIEIEVRLAIESEKRRGVLFKWVRFFFVPKALRHIILDEFQNLLGHLREENVKLTHEAVEVYKHVVESYGCVPNVIACQFFLVRFIKTKYLRAKMKFYQVFSPLK